MHKSIRFSNEDNLLLFSPSRKKHPLTLGLHCVTPLSPKVIHCLVNWMISDLGLSHSSHKPVWIIQTRTLTSFQHWKPIWKFCDDDTRVIWSWIVAPIGNCRGNRQSTCELGLAIRRFLPLRISRQVDNPYSCGHFEVRLTYVGLSVPKV